MTETNEQVRGSLHVPCCEQEQLNLGVEGGHRDYKKNRSVKTGPRIAEGEGEHQPRNRSSGGCPDGQPVRVQSRLSDGVRGGGTGGENSRSWPKGSCHPEPSWHKTVAEVNVTKQGVVTVKRALPGSLRRITLQEHHRRLTQRLGIRNRLPPPPKSEIKVYEQK